MGQIKENQIKSLSINKCETFPHKKHSVKTMYANNKKHYPNPFPFHISFILDDGKIGLMDQRRNSELRQIGPTILTHMYSSNANHHESRNLDVEINSGIIEIMNNKDDH